MADKKRIDEATGTSTVGHEWDGIEELDTPMPRWWLWTFYATIAWAAVYVVLYPAWPLVERATAGTLGWSSRGDLHAELAAETARRAPVMAALSTTPMDRIMANEQLRSVAVQGGRAAFKVHCVQCHGSGAAGSPAYPNLNDDDWLWGGDIDAIHYTLEHGIRNPDHAETRASAMPAFGAILQPAEIDTLVSQVRVLSGKGQGTAAGAKLYADNCAVCHGPTGKGDRKVGAPNLTDGIWLYGGDTETLRTTIANSRQGVMPRWNDKLDPVTIKMLAAYVHSLGGGEATPDVTAPAAQAIGATTTTTTTTTAATGGIAAPTKAAAQAN